MLTDHNAADFFVDRHANDATLRDKAAFIEVDGACRHLNYGQLAAQSAQMVGLLQRHDLRREERAAMLVLDQIEFPVIFWGAIKAGVIPVPLNSMLPETAYDAILGDSRAVALFVSAALYPKVAAVAARWPDLRKIFVIGTPAAVQEEASTPLCFTTELAASHPGISVAVSPDDIAFWLYSSGSTGEPKGIRHVHASLRVTAETYAAQVLGIRSDDVGYSAAKLFFAYGLGNAMTFPLSVGATSLLLADRPTPQTTLMILNMHRPTLFFGVPTLYAAMLAFVDGLATAPESSLRMAVSAGEALPEQTGRRFCEMFGVDVLDGVGSTEMLHIFLSNAPGNVVYGTSGVAVPGYDLRLVNEKGDPSQDGEIGEMLVRGDSAADGYWNKRTKTRTTFLGEWTRTGDKYEITKAGRYRYCGRSDDMFKVSGIWTSPFEIENALASHPAVLESAVVAARDREGLEKPRAFIVIGDNYEAEEALADTLKEHVKTRIGMWKYPRWIVFVESLPKTPTGKIQRFKLRD